MYWDLGHSEVIVITNVMEHQLTCAACLATLKYEDLSLQRRTKRDRTQPHGRSVNGMKATGYLQR